MPISKEYVLEFKAILTRHVQEEKRPFRGSCG